MDQLAPTQASSQIPEDVKAEVKATFKEIDSGERHWRKTFERMRADQKFARGQQWKGVNSDGTTYDTHIQDYVANFTLRMVQNKVATIYARDPTLDIKPRETLDYLYWDGDPASLTPDNPLLPNILAEIDVVKRERHIREQQARTLSIVLKQAMDSPRPNFKKGAKANVRRALINGVGYCKLGFRRAGVPMPEKDAQTGTPGDLAGRLHGLYSLSQAKDTTDDQRKALQQRMDQTAAGLTAARPQTEAGLVFSWPWPTNVVLDPGTLSLDELQGCGWLAEIYYYSREKILEIYGIDLKDRVQSSWNYAHSEDYQGAKHDPSQPGCDGEIIYKVYEFWDRRSGVVKTLCRGYEGYLRAPAEPGVSVEGFFPYYPFAPNLVEDESNPFPPSEVSLNRDMQVDHNTARQGLRDHRVANRPGMITPRGALEEDDKDKLRNRAAFTVVEANLTPETPLNNLMVPIPRDPIDPALYDTSMFQADMLLTSGQQEANLGGTAGATATEVGVAETSRQTATGSITDDLDEWLTVIFRAAAEILLSNLSQEEAVRIAGRGAVWPVEDGRAIADELIVNIKAGSSGRPNRALELANFRDMAPIIMQLPGIRPEWVAKEIKRRLGDSIDLEDMYASGLPSIVATNGQAGIGQMNAEAGGATGDPGKDPAMQGGQGSFNAPQAPQSGTRVETPPPDAQLI